MAQFTASTTLAEFDDAAVACALDDAPMMHRNGRVDQVAAKGPKASQDSILVASGQPRVADDVGDQDGGKFSGLAHGASALGHPGKGSRRRAQNR
jgi:hypothetical protein